MGYQEWDSVLNPEMGSSGEHDLWELGKFHTSFCASAEAVKDVAMKTHVHTLPISHCRT